MFNARAFHDSVVSSSRRLFVDGHHTIAVYKAFVRVNNRVKKLSGISDDGRSLMGKAFCEKEKHPVLQMSDLVKESEINEHDGIRFMMMGGWSAMRSPRVHEDEWEPDKDIATVLDALSFASLLHRFLDRCEAYREAGSS